MKYLSEEKGYKILALAFILLIASAVLMFSEHKERGAYEKKKVIVNTFKASESVLKNYPDVNAFQRFTFHASKEWVENNSIHIKSQCNDAYITVLVFDALFDYRLDPARAVVNRALACNLGHQFEYVFSANEFGRFEEGKVYYVFIADQGTQGVWYNPR